MSECVSECCIEGPNNKDVLPHMTWQACMFSSELIWEGVAPPQDPQEKVE